MSAWKMGRVLVVAVVAVGLQLAYAAPDDPSPTTGSNGTSVTGSGSLPPPPPPPPSASSGSAGGSGSSNAPKQTDLESELSAGERVPDNPALDLLGAEDLKVTKPGSLKDLETDLRALYKDGKVVPQVAVEFSPYDLTLGRSSTYDDYLKSSLTQVLHRITVSVATTATGSDTSATTVGAAGLRVRIIDDTDWRLNKAAVDCALKAIELEKPPQHSPEHPGIVVAPSDAADKNADAVAACFKDHAAKWNATQLALGAALSSSFPQGKLQADIDDVASWMTFAHAISDSAQLTIGGKYLFNSTYPKKHTGGATAQIEYRGDKYGSILYAGAGERWTKSDPSMGWTTGFVGLVGGEFQMKISDQTWLALRFSAQIAPDSGDSVLSLANFKWSYDVTHDRSK